MAISQAMCTSFKAEILEGTINKLIDWERKGYRIILTTGRKESMREQTVKQLQDVGIMYDLLIMGLGSGPRYLINDKRPENGQETAFAINLEKDKGISDINI